MSGLLFKLSFALVSVFALSASSHAQSAGDEKSVRAVVASWDDAWNRHDMNSLAKLFTVDADFVNVGGRHWKGREQIELQHQARLKQFKNSVWTTKFVSVQFLKPDIAVAHIDWVLEGDTDPDGTARPARGGVFTWVLSKHGETWQIRAAQNTNLGNLAPHSAPGQPDTLPPMEPSSQPMPDGKRWTLANLSVEIPGSYCFDDESAKCKRYGRLYTWTAAQEACRSLGPSWRLPSMGDWKMLAQNYGGLFGDGPGNGKVAYRELLAGGKSGLEMLLGGGRQDDGYARLEAHGFYWSTTEESPTSARLLNFGKGSGTVYDQDGGEKTSAYSVRCVADERR